MPQNLRTVAYLIGVPFDESTARAVRSALSAVTPVDAIRTSVRADWISSDGVDVTGKSLYLRTPELGRSLALHPYSDGDIELDWSFEGDARGDLVARLARELCAAFPGKVRFFHRYEDLDFGASPSPPLARDRIVVAFPEAFICEYYRSVEAFAEVWDETEQVEGGVIASRALEAEDVAGALFESNWALARIAEPGTTDYLLVIDPRTPGEEAKVKSQPDVLKWNGYRESDQAHAYTAAIFAGDTHKHISAREVYALRSWKRRGSDGERPVKHIRVHFPDREAAQRECRPLVDGGVEVLYLDEDGEYAPVE